ncbi:MAG: coenzyme F420-0:L-glutamate ligase, partial [Nitrosopumilaceae archaeon]
KQEGRIVNLSTVIPSLLAQGIGSEYKKDPKLLEVILSESKRIVRMENGIIIVETKNGFICANAGIDESNVHNGFVTLLPLDPNKSAQKLREEISQKSGKSVAVLISDTFGRPFRMGQTDCAIGVSGIDSILDYEGKKDTFGKTLRVTAIAIADELCSAAELVMGKTTGSPAAIIRNYKFTPSDDSAKSLIRPKEEDLFR